MDRPRFSEMLSERRRQLGFSITQASRVLRLKEDVLVAFEEGDFDAMPKSGYAQGMLSSYARYLGLDASEVVDLFVDEQEQWRRAMRRSRGTGKGGSSDRERRQGGVSQPYVAKRGLLPTSGGPAGDMGSFATTRVHTRTSVASGEETDSGQAYEQRRPYTGRIPDSARYSGWRSGRGDIRAMDMSESGFEDDLRFGNEAQQYEAASTRRGRTSSRNISRADRPRVRRRGDNRRGDRNRGRSSGRNSRQSVYDGVFGSGDRRVLLMVVGAIAVISIILVVTIGSCVRQNLDTAKTVPVGTTAAVPEDSSSKNSGTATDASSSATATSGQEATGATSTEAGTTGTGSSTTSGSKRSAETSVSISVAEGAVTWLEVECDGKSDVAETITGPWQRTYTVDSSLTVQAGDTTAVTVVQDGRQVQFDSMASGIGTLRIQGSGKKSSTSSDKASTATDQDKTTGEGSASDTTTSSGKTSSSSEGTSAKTGNASATSGAQGSAEGEDGETEENGEVVSDHGSED